jgi:peroxiredoxin Q/BCP
MAADDRKPSEGQVAPDFTLPVTDPSGSGASLTLSSLTSKPVVLFFYPKDDTSGCTTEAIDFTGAKGEFDKLGVVLIGMSPDPLKKHFKFKDKHGLGMELVSDEDKKTLEAYGVWVEKSMYGKKYMGVERSTFLIGKGGKVLKAWRKVSVPGHVNDVLEAARELV